MQWLNQLGAEISQLPDQLSAGWTQQGLLPVSMLAAVVVAAWGLQRALRSLGNPLIEAISHWERSGGKALGPARRMLAILAAIGLRGIKTVAMIALIYAVVASGWLGNGAVALMGQYFVVAFASVELSRLILNGILEPRSPQVRLAALDDQTAEDWERKLSWLIRWSGYGLLWLVPSIQLAGAGLSDLVMLLVLIVALYRAGRLIQQAREPVREWLKAVAQRGHGVLISFLLGLLASVWHGLAMVYLLALSLLVLLAPAEQVQALLLASAGTLIYLGIGGFLGHWVSVFAHAGIVLPKRLRLRLPMLQIRLQSWLPLLLRLVHAILTIVVVGLVLDLWGVFNFVLWLGSPLGQTIIGGVLALSGVALAALAAWLFAVSWIEDRLNPETGHGAPGAREKTLLALFRNAVAIVIVTLAVMIGLSEIGVDIGPLLAGAGVIGLAVGFGAQKLVQDNITGVFIQLEDAIHQDDYITAAGISGTVERLSIRSLGLRDLTGTLHVIPFSSVDTVSNFTRDFGYHLGEYGVAYRENIGEVIEHLHKAYELLCADPAIAESVTGPLEVDGVTALADSSVNLRVRIRTTAGMHWAVGRAYNRYVKEVFDEAGIEIPFPHMTVYFGEDKSGLAPPARLAITQTQGEGGQGESG